MADTPDTMICSKCSKVKNISEMRQDKSKKFGVRTYCKACVNKEYNKESRVRYYQKNRDRIIKSTKLYKIKQRYGLSELEYEKLLYSHPFCEICFCQFEQGEIACVDHDHDTGLVRGVLCKKCNSALGLFRDDLILVKQAAIYLSRSKKGKAK